MATSRPGGQRQPDHPAQLHPGQRASEARLDVGLQELDQAALPLSPSRRVSWREAIASRSDDEIGARARQADRPRTAPRPPVRAGRPRGRAPPPARTRRRTSSSELSAARICASVSAISPARVRPTGDGSGSGNGEPDPEDAVVDLAALGERGQGRVGHPLAPDERTSRASSTWRSISAAATSPRSASACSSSAPAGHARAGAAAGSASGRAQPGGVHGQQGGERGARVRQPPLRLEADEADARRLGAGDVRLDAGDQRLLGARLGVGGQRGRRRGQLGREAQRLLRRASAS